MKHHPTLILLFCSTNRIANFGFVWPHPTSSNSFGPACLFVLYWRGITGLRVSFIVLKKEKNIHFPSLIFSFYVFVRYLLISDQIIVLTRPFTGLLPVFFRGVLTNCRRAYQILSPWVYPLPGSPQDICLVRTEILFCVMLTLQSCT